MKIAVSNIAWPAESDDAAYELLRRAGVTGLEVAPTRVWPGWQGITPSSLAEYRQRVEDAGLQISSLQSILFQKPELQMFGTDGGFAEHLRYCADLAAALGAKCVVLGAPKNRLRGNLTEADAMQRAVNILFPIAEYYAQQGVALCLEANPEQYACDFVTRGSEAASLVRRVDSPGLRLHLDTACALLAGDDIAVLVRDHIDILAHFHASESMLGDFNVPSAQHDTAAHALCESDYKQWVAVEMRTQPDALASLATAVQFVMNTYGGEL
jgi:sugar phosphate isomerase/epimerase